MEKKQRLKQQIAACLLASFLAVPAAVPAANTVISNVEVPTGGHTVGGNAQITYPNEAGIKLGDLVNIHQTTQNAAITWKDFSVGANATVNFNGDKANFNTLNYVNGGNISQIYGTINANNNGNIYLVNPSGVQISKSAQINVGSLYVSNAYLDESKLSGFDGANVRTLKDTGRTSNRELMSLGNINATKVTFDGGRIVIDTERLKDNHTKLTAAQIDVQTTDRNNVVLGYHAYDSANGYAGKNDDMVIATVNGGEFTKRDGYMWVENVQQLQKLNTNLSGRYAMRNGIDATSSSTFNSIGTSGAAFTGAFDGLGFKIFDLNVSAAGTDDVGLFGYTKDAAIRNVTLVGGEITGKNNVGSVIGYMDGGTLSNVINSVHVNGQQHVGGIVGHVEGPEGDQAGLTGLVNTGVVRGSKSDVGGVIGSMTWAVLDGATYNYGSVTGAGYNVGGVVGQAVYSTLGSEGGTLQNRMDVTGQYNVGGIVGSMAVTTVRHAENRGAVTATGHREDTYSYHSDYQTVGIHTAQVYAANVGGIAGSSSNTSSISDVLNTGDVRSYKGDGNDYYDAGNVGGIVGRAEDTNITNGTNKENDVYGAHNVGGIAGYFGVSGKIADRISTIVNGINDGGDIMATGARYNNAFVTEIIRKDYNNENKERYIIGNIGGVAGYLYGDDAYISGGGNRGDVHTYIPAGTNAALPDASKAANVGGVAGKVDRSVNQSLAMIKGDSAKAAISGTGNTGSVRGYTAVGGIAGMMYNGEVAKSYNMGTISSTRQVSSGSGTEPLNMGGIVGDTTEHSSARVTLYDVYNKGQIGDKTYTYSGRHVGGIVGRLSGIVEKAYNTGAIYNGYNVVGGIAGYWYTGAINNVFNTGNITVKNTNTATSQVGGIVGSVDLTHDAGIAKGDVTLSNAYNLGTLRSFQNGGAGKNAIGGIIGAAIKFTGVGDPYALHIENAYTTGNIYAGVQTSNTYAEDATNRWGARGSILGDNQAGTARFTNTYYIKPENNTFTAITNNQNANKAIAYTDRSDISAYTYTDGTGTHSLSFSSQSDGDVTGNTEDNWRIYAGNTPILNAFLPKAEDYFGSQTDDHMEGIGTIQYGTAYDPLLTIIHAAGNKNLLQYNWKELGISDNEGLAVYGAGLTLNDFGKTNGTIYSDGALTVGGQNISISQAAQLYGSSVDIRSDGALTLYGTVQATGNGEEEKAGDITLEAGEVNLFGTLTSAKQGETVTILGIQDTAREGTVPGTPEQIKNPVADMVDLGDRFAHTTDKEAGRSGDITITTDAGKGSGDVNLYFGNMEKGKTTAYGDLTINGAGDVYMDSDLSIGGNLNVTAPGEIVLDISHIGQVGAANSGEAVSGLHDFLDHFAKKENPTAADPSINFKKPKEDTYANVKIAVDLWNDGTKTFDYTKYDKPGGEPGSFAKALQAVNVNADGEPVDTTTKNMVYLWVNNAEQLEAIQKSEAGDTASTMAHNYALKNDIDASVLTDYEAIGTGKEGGYQGIFDGRDKRIIGLAVEGKDAGLFSTIGEKGTVQNVTIFSGTFDGTDSAGTIAGVNHGYISNVTAFGNVVTAKGSSTSQTITDTFDVNKDGHTTDAIHVGAAGGIAGVNTGGINSAQSIGTVIADAAADGSGAYSTAGGIVGINRNGENEGVVYESSSNSAVTAVGTATYGLGGIAGVNMENSMLIQVESLGVTRGIYPVSETETHKSSYVGGIAGINDDSTIWDAYNAGTITGSRYVGGIAGVNNASIQDIVNAGDINRNDDTRPLGQLAGFEYIGGLVGNNVSGGTNPNKLTNGRNSGAIYGKTYVGGMVGHNGTDSILENLVNDSSAAITGYDYVGGIAGSNEGTISAAEEGLTNRGSIMGQNYVGGVAGTNTGTITNVNNDVTLHVKEAGKAKFFGGVAGENATAGTIENATNRADIEADGASYVGGVVGKNSGTLQGLNGNYGSVTGGSYVGGVVGRNEQAITGVTAENTGTVKATQGGAGGIFGENTAAITNATLTNSGSVTGTYSNTVAGTGGIIGVNSGTIITTSLKNEIGGHVSGTQNVGGLIGINTGTVTGGRNEADTQYVYQIYNNGVITAAGSGTNIGGLIGDNQAGGKLTGGYNTGAIEAANSKNVGGIAGTNSGAIDQVFNTVYNTNGNAGAIAGGTNVGGLVGHNAAGGTVTNGYNTTEVTGTATAGHAAGQNDGVVSYVYGTGDLIGNGTKETYGYVVDADGKWNQADSYTGFDFDGINGETPVWRIYEGHGHPLLKIFLTRAKYDGSMDFTYNGQNQGLDINEVTAADGKNAYNNANALLQFLQNKNAGRGYLGIVSEQIAASGTGDTFNPNNLGYDIDVNYTIGKATLSILLDAISRVYGNPAIANGDKNNYGYSFGGMELTAEMKAELTDANLGYVQGTDGAVEGASGNRKTNNANAAGESYIWEAAFMLKNGLENNYQFDEAGAAILNTTGKSAVTKERLVLHPDDITVEQGQAPHYTGSVPGFVNGDSFDVSYGISLSDKGKLLEEGIHTDVIGFWTDKWFYGKGSDLSSLFGGNYDIDFAPGTLNVTAFSGIWPDRPDSHWNYLYQDKPFNTTWNDRERKAELHFVNGGMKI